MKRYATIGTAVLLSAGFSTASANQVPELAVLGPEYPRAFFFRSSENGAYRQNASYERWAGEYGRLMGIMGKCLDEEIVGRGRLNPEWYSRFKRDHPGQAVLLHFNGNARDPRYATERYFAGHWVYRGAVKILSDVPAEEGETEIRVADAGGFRIGGGRYRISNDDVALFGVTADGRHDWSRCEQVQLLSADARAGTIRVRRGCYGTRPLAFKAGVSRAAAHQVEGPWGRDNHLLWYYNFSSLCPRDEEGKSCADRLVEELGRWFGRGGVLEALDGLEFDVMFNETQGDTDGDGVEDGGVVGGLNVYGIGMAGFAKALRERLGPGRIIQGDGALGPGGAASQRAFGFLNGIESEGWPDLRDWRVDDWSGGLNRHLFWQANAFAPAFSYINHKWVEGVPGQPGETRNVEVPFSRHRLAFAGAMFCDAAVTYAYMPPAGKGMPVGLWDELVCGVEGRPGWLGRPLGPAVRLAAGEPDRLAGAGAPAGQALAGRIRGAVNVAVTPEGVVVRAAGPAAGEVAFSIRDVPAGSADFTVFLTASAAPRAGYPEGMARFAEVGVAGDGVPLSSAQPEAVGMCLRGAGEAALESATGALARYQREAKVGGAVLSAVAVHPPFKACKGAVFWCRDVEVPAGAELRFSLGMGPRAPERSDGVWYSVHVAALDGGQAGVYEKVFEETTKAHAWLPRAVPLAQWAGRRVSLKFVADCGPNDHATTDQGYWGDVKLVPAGVPEAGLTPPQSRMTWLNARPFDAAFYFRDVRSGTVSLTFRIEGAEPVVLRSLTAHAAVDTRARLFENGLVLGNPGHSPATFDLARLAPGRSYRRLRATPLQDTQANNGEPVGATVALGALDGLFLRLAR